MSAARPPGKTATVTLYDGVHVVVPDTLAGITPYALLEQRDWFEHELGFLRRLIGPGEQVVDIGANHGVYTLSLARAVGPGGGVWACEPATATADRLAASIADNGFAQVTLERCALSGTPGSARLRLGGHSELNALEHGDTPPSDGETVRVDTLDAAHRRCGWHAVALLKVDAGGEEAAIVDGGRRFLAEASPLVQYEVKAGSDWHLGLVDRFAALGYAPYRLVPGLDLLVPFDATQPPEPYLLNLYACKPDRAARLAALGRLVTADELARAATEPVAVDPSAGRSALAALPYTRALAAGPHARAPGAPWRAADTADVDEALALYAASQDPRRDAAQRFVALDRSLARLRRGSTRAEPALQGA